MSPVCVCSNCGHAHLVNPHLTARPTLTGPNRARCGWCHEVHDFEGIKACRRAARVGTEVVFAETQERLMLLLEVMEAEYEGDEHGVA